jgi:hypothetical protein
VSDYIIANPTANFDNLEALTTTVGDFLAKAVEADRADFMVGGGSCAGQLLPANVSATHTDKDLIILMLPTTSVTLDGRMSAGRVCIFDSPNINRPVVGALLFNVDE